MTILDACKKSLQQKRIVRLKMKHPFDDCYDGVVLKIERTFIVMAVESNFEFDGISVFVKKFIKGYRNGPNEICTDRIIRNNGQLNKFKLPVWLDRCESLEDVLRACYSRRIWPSIEIVYNDYKDSAFFIGPIISGGDVGIELKCYDSAGIWEKAYKIPYFEIMRIDVSSTYAKHFNRYMKGKK